jgi:hypothetical protein
LRVFRQARRTASVSWLVEFGLVREFGACTITSIACAPRREAAGFRFNYVTSNADTPHFVSLTSQNHWAAVVRPARNLASRVASFFLKKTYSVSMPSLATIEIRSFGLACDLQ